MIDLRDGRRRHAEPLVVERLGRPAASASAGEREVDEPGPGDLDRRQRAAGVAERPDHALGQAARRLAELLGQLHGEVRLQVEPRLARRGHQRVDVGQSGLTLDRRAEGGRELMVGRRDHAYEPRAARSPRQLRRARVPRSSQAWPRRASTSAAARFSSRWLGVRVPGIGTMSGAWCSSQASASCAGVRSSSAARLAQRREAVAVARPGSRGLKRGWLARKSSPIWSAEPARKPAPSGDQGTNPIPSSFRTGSSSRSGSRVHSEYSPWTAASGWTWWAAMTCSAVTLESPRWRTLPSRHELGHRADGLLDRHARVREVQVPEVDDVDAEPLQAALGGLAGALGAGVDEDLLGVRVLHRAAVLEDDAPLGRELDVAAVDRAADEPLVRARGVGVGGVDHGRAGVDRVGQRRQRALVVGVAVHAVDRGPSRRSRWRTWSGAEVAGLHGIDGPRGVAVAATGPDARLLSVSPMAEIRQLRYFLAVAERGQRVARRRWTCTSRSRR